MSYTFDSWRPSDGYEEEDENKIEFSRRETVYIISAGAAAGAIVCGGIGGALGGLEGLVAGGITGGIAGSIGGFFFSLS